MIFITGDIHGEINAARLSNRRFNAAKSLTKNDYVIIAGDFGLLWRAIPSKAEDWLKWLEERPFTTLFVDGNHENFTMLNALDRADMFEGKVGVVSDSIFHLRRGEVYRIDNKKIFTFGGAVSTDKNGGMYNGRFVPPRVEGVSWWREEECSVAECNYAIDNLELYGNYVDIIITHTAPYGASSKRFQPHNFHSSTAKFLQHVRDTVTYDQWYCGHFHIDDWLGYIRCVYNDIIQIT